jgi:hypothetical protein
MMKVDLDNGALVAQTDNVSGAPMQFKLTNLGGWQSGAPLRTSVEDLPQGDGALPPSKSYRSARALSLEGVVYGGTAEEAEELAWDRIAGLSPMGQSMRLAVTTAVGERWMRVWLSSAPQVLPFGPNRARFQVPLVAPDPRKYSETKQYPAKLAGRLRGRPALPPRWRCGGPVPGLRHLRARRDGHDHERRHGGVLADVHTFTALGVADLNANLNTAVRPAYW